MLRLFEPLPKNTAPAITVASMLCENDSNILVLPSDHYIHDNENFLNQLERAKVMLRITR